MELDHCSHRLVGNSVIPWAALRNAAADEHSQRPHPSMPQPSVTVENHALWAQFHTIVNEMIVTKAGRRMFPLLRVKLSNLDPSASYCLLLEFQPTHTHRWRFLNGRWQPGSKATELPEQRWVYVHPASPSSGTQWMQGPVTFAKLKLSNKENGSGKIKLTSLHKYQPCVHLVKLSPSPSEGLQLQEAQQITSHSIPETQFIAVTAYQNDKITQMKIKHNPFAKAFLGSQEREEEPTSKEPQLPTPEPARTRPDCRFSSTASDPTTATYSFQPSSSSLSSTTTQCPTTDSQYSFQQTPMFVPSYNASLQLHTTYPPKTTPASPLSHYSPDSMLQPYWTTATFAHTHMTLRNSYCPPSRHVTTPLGYHD